MPNWLLIIQWATWFLHCAITLIYLMSYKLHYVSDSQCASQPHKMFSNELLLWQEILPYPTRRRILIQDLIPCSFEILRASKRGRQGVNFLSLIDTTTKDHQFGVRSVWEGQRAPEVITDPERKGCIQNWWNSWSNGFKVWEHLEINFGELNKSVSQMIFELHSRKDY